MNNNYHTQMEKPNNNMLNEIAANNQLLQQTGGEMETQPRNAYQQMQNFQGTPINRPIAPPYPGDCARREPVSDFQSHLNDMGEIELSDSKLETKALKQQPASNPIPNLQPQLQPQSQQSKPRQPQLPLTIKPKTEQSSALMEYVIIPIILLITFIVLVYPLTSQYIDKYLPPAKDLKGVAIRGVIMAVVYVITKFITGMVGQ